MEYRIYNFNTRHNASANFDSTSAQRRPSHTDSTPPSTPPVAAGANATTNSQREPVAELPASNENPPGYISRQMSWESGAEAGYRPSSSGTWKKYG